MTLIRPARGRDFHEAVKLYKSFHIITSSIECRLVLGGMLDALLEVLRIKPRVHVGAVIAAVEWRKDQICGYLV